MKTLWRDQPLTNYVNLEVTPHKLNSSFKTETVKEEQKAFTSPHVLPFASST